ncbi:MAG: stage II sporulation protein R [Oscillospiraceae bacterium]
MRKWIQAGILFLVAVCIVCAYALDREQSELSDKLIRLHVVAASDSEEDQALKLEVRDKVLSELSMMLSGTTDREEALTIISENEDILREAASAVVNEAGVSDDVTVTLKNEDFPTRDYDTFSLPAGEYESLRIVIGEGEGHNWWCVVFPPICTEAAIDQGAAAVSLTDDEKKLITGENEGYVIKFKSIEIYEKIKMAIF